MAQGDLEDIASVYLAIPNGVDPRLVAKIDFLKNELENIFVMNALLSLMMKLACQFLEEP